MRILILLILLSFAFSLSAQEDDIIVKRPLQKSTFKLGLTSFIEYPPVIEPGFELRLKEHTSFNFHVGGSGISYGPDLGAWFLRSKNEIRWYIDEFGSKEQNLCFVSVEGTYRFQKESRTEWLSRFGGAFQQEYNFKRFRHVGSLFINYGWQSRSKNSNLVTDCKIGIGYRFHKLTTDLPIDAEEGNVRVIIPSVVNTPGNFAYPMINFIIAGGYVLKQ